MYLKQIVINGFKSFALRTELALEPGVTCIVGPNGCGKSNIVDAIRWVLGEQSAKALRGGKMQDVIFEGTDKRKPLSLCEVSLTFSNCEEALGAGFNEVEITRRVTRDSSSDYLINGKSCRLKDIQRLFMDTGIGRVSYSFLVQGQIDQILSSNPAERRIIFEEAAGITKYKSQRQEALNKLAHVDQNLSRVTDVLEEMSRQLGSLERQARKAVRYQHLNHRYSHLDLAEKAYRYGVRRQNWEALAKDAQGKRQNVEAQQNKVSAQEAQLEKMRFERTQAYEKLRETQELSFNIKAELDQSHNKIQICEARLQDLNTQSESTREEIARLQARCEKLTSQRQSENVVRAEQEGVVGESDGVLKNHQEALQAAQKSLSAVELQLAQKKMARTKLQESHERLRSEATRYEVELKSLEAQSAHLLSNSESLIQDLEQAQNVLREAEAGQEASETERVESQNQAQQAQASVQTRLEAFKEIQRQIQEQDRALARLNAERQVLEDLQAKFEGFSEGAKAILQGKLAESMGESVKPAMRSMDIDVDYTVAIEALLGAASDCLALETIQDALSWVRALEAKKLGRACFQVPVAHSRSQSRALPGFLKPTSDVARTLEPELEARVRGFFEGTYTCDSLENFLIFWQENPDFNFLLVATQAGELIDARGLVFGGNRIQASGKTSVLQRDAQMRTLKKQMDAEQIKLAQMRDQAAEAQQSLSEAEKVLDTARQGVMQASQKVSASAAQKRAAEDLLHRAQQALQRRQGEQESLVTRIQAAQQRFVQISGQTQSSDAQKADIDNLITVLDAEAIRTRSIVDNKRETLSAIQLDFLQKRQRLELLNSELTQIESEIRGTEHRLQHLRHNLSAGAQQKATYAKDIEHHKALKAELAVRMQAEQVSLQETQQGLLNTEKSIRELEEQLNGLRQTLRTQEQALSSLEVRRAEQHAQVLFLEERARADYNQEIAEVKVLEQLKAAYSPFKIQPPLDAWVDEHDQATILKKSKLSEIVLPEDLGQIDWDHINHELKELKSRILSLGAVNLVAIEEYASLKERHDFLKAQSEDLMNSKVELTAAIEQINQTSEGLFKTTFDQVRTNFKRTFEKLFGGGQADLILSAGEDPLNAGIEIIACPPGTRLKGLTLLSGGQKTMTAVALLFAIYQVKPSPFCVLDELDAPLDDANIGRFTQMLREFTEFSQFLVITHNKRTIGSADCIYGVTMPERGVTQLVSMRFAGKDMHDESAQPAIA